MTPIDTTDFTPGEISYVNMNVLSQKKQPGIVILPFSVGGRICLDLEILLGTHEADRLLRLVVDYCQFSIEHYGNQLEKITQLASTNPKNIPGVEDMVMNIGKEVYAAAFRYKLFEAVPGSFPYMYHKLMAGGRLALIRKTLV